MLDGLFGREAILGFLHQQMLDKVFRQVRDVVPALIFKVIFSVHNLLKEGCVRIRIEGRVAGQQYIGDDTNTPHIDALII